MTIRPGDNLIRLTSALLGLSLLGLAVSGGAWPAVVGAAALAACAGVEYRDLRRRVASVSVKRTTPTVVGRDVPFEVELRVERQGDWPLEGELRQEAPDVAVPPLTIHDVRIAADATSTAVFEESRLPTRGRWTFGSIWLRVRGRWNLWEAQWSVPASDDVKVLPEGYASRDNLRQDDRAALMQLDKASKTRQHGAGTEFEMLSEFRPGDDPRRIDWRTTARYGRPVVRRFQIERHRDMMIILDCGRLMAADARRGSKLDCAVDAALMLCRTALQGGDRCGLALFDDQVLGYLPPVSGLRSLRGMAEGVYDAQSRWRESNFARMFATLQQRQTKRSLIVVLSDIVDVETSAQFRRSLAALGKRHVVLFAAIRTPLLREIVHQPIDSVLDGAKQVVTFRILRERAQAIHSLERGGVHVLDVEPTQLTIPLINSYLDLRGRNLL